MSKILKIITEPNPDLRRKSAEIDPDMIGEEEFKKFYLDMAHTMRIKDGVGLAAPQVGKNIRVVVINTKNGEIVMINPEITKFSWSKEWMDEGCLSVPTIFGKVQRPKKIQCSYTNIDGERIRLEASGLMARVIQHELDHLDGILFIDKAKNLHTQKSY